MRLVSFTVEKYRSILSARQIPVGATTTLIGPNNEGKSNILRALALGMKALTEMHRPHRIRSTAQRRFGRSRFRQRHTYDWDLDFPITMQPRNKDGGSLITLEFELTNEETGQFKEFVGNKLNGRLPISLLFKRDGTVDPLILKQGPGQKILTKKAPLIAQFLAERIDIQYIPAIRTSEAAIEVVDALIEKELAVIENDERYTAALLAIEALQAPILESLSKNIETTMKKFVSGLSSVEIKIEQGERNIALRRASSVIINDGVATDLQQKGEGVQSLAALAIMRHASESSDRQKDVIIALEEPESHLHPSAIHQLRQVLEELSARQQVVLTTHNPLSVSRDNIASNIIVNKNKASPANDIKKIRDVLGVKLSDNLHNAELVLIVEGEEDKVALTALLSNKSAKLSSALKSRSLVIDVLGGAGNLNHRLRMHIDGFCKVHTFLDSDKAGKLAFRLAEDEKLLGIGDVNFANWGIQQETELEDIYKDEVWLAVVKELALASTKHPDVQGKKWSDRIKVALKAAGKPSDDPYIQMLKARVAEEVRTLGWGALHPSKVGPIESLIAGLEGKLEEY